MKRIKKGIFALVIVAFCLVISFSVFGVIDCIRFQKDESPIFIIKKDVMNDGGTTIYYGVGYQLIDWKIIDGDETATLKYKVGKEIHIFNFVDPLSGEPEVTMEVQTD